MSKKLTLDYIKDKLKDRAVCLSTEYLDNKGYLLFKCNHCLSEFKQQASKALSGKKNPCCVINKKKTLSEIVDFSSKKGLTFLGSNFEGVDKDHSWKCNTCGKEFIQKYVYLKDNKNSCPHCFPIIFRTNDEIKEIVESKGYSLLSIGEKRRLTLNCPKCGKDFEITLSKMIHNNQGCTHCQGLRKYDLDFLQKESLQKGCTLLSDKYNGFDNYHKFKCNKCSYQWEQTYNSFHRYFLGCSKCLGLSSHSKGEFQIRDFLFEITKQNWMSNRSLLGGKEIDLYNSNFKYAFEFCGIYYHCELFKKNNYHYEKMNKCLDKGIHLITIFEDEWEHNSDKVKSRIKSILSLNDYKYYGRDLQIKEISSKDSDKFYSENHLQGKPKNTIVSFGIFKNEEIIGSLSLGRHPRDHKSESICLTRLCFKMNTYVVGGSEKLFKACLAWSKIKNFSQIISWSDNRWSIGNVYGRLGFKLDQNLLQDYSYVDMSNILRYSKSSLRKNKSERVLGLTEHQLRLNQKKYRIYDCGKKRWVFNL